MKIDIYAAPVLGFLTIRSLLAILLTAFTISPVLASSSENGEKFNAGEMIIHHIKDAHSIHFPGFTMPLPCIVNTPNGMDFFMSSVFMDEHHGWAKTYTSAKTGNTYALVHEKIVIIDGGTSNPESHQHVPADSSLIEVVEEPARADSLNQAVHNHGNADPHSLGSHGTPVSDFSITKSVLGMLVMLIVVIWIFTSVARAYQKRKGRAPKGLQNLLEPLILFIRDEVAIPAMGKQRAKKFLPFLLSMFFFIWACNLLGLIPFIGGFNITGTLSITLVMAAMVFVITTINGNRHYWGHILWPPGVPFPVKLILVPIEIASIFIKPLVLMIRLTANINAGHIVILALTSLIFIFAEKGAGAGYGVGVASTAFMIFMYFIELLVAFLQAYVFTLLAALYFGDATQEHHHEEHAHAEAHVH